MSSVLSRSVIVAGALLLAASWTGASVPQDPEVVRARLLEMFADPAAASPTVLAGLAEDRATLAAVRARIEGMSAEELAAIGEAMGGLPAWQAAPELVAGALPPEVRTAVARRGAVLAAEVAEGLEMRRRVGALAALARLAPAPALSGIGLDPDVVARQAAQLGGLDAVELGAAQSAAGGPSSWRGATAGVLDTLPPELRDGLVEMGAHYPFDDAELERLEGFRAHLLHVLDGILELPGEPWAGLDLEAAADLANRVRSAIPEELYLLRREVDAEDLRRLGWHVELRARAMALSPDVEAELRAFREELAAAAEAGGVGGAVLANRFRSAADAEMLARWELVHQLPFGREAAMAAVRAQASPFLMTILQEGSRLKKGELPGLEAFRGELVATVSHLPPSADQTWQRDATVAALEDLPPLKLALVREAVNAVGGIHSVRDLSVAVTAAALLAVDLDCRFDLGRICIPIPGIPDPCVSLGSLDLNWICTPLENAINAVANSIAGLIGNVLQWFQQTWDQITELPQTVWSALKAAWEQLLGPLWTYLTDPNTLAGAMGLFGDFYNSIPNLPTPPCPPPGTLIAGFGEVGDGETATRFSKYKFFADQLLGLIPETEVSLAVKISGKLTYGAVEYLGECLDAAAADAEGAATEAYREGVNSALAGSSANQNAILAAMTQRRLRAEQLAWLDLRVKIEQNLGAPPGENVGLFQIPQSAGGYLETVMDVVEDTIVMMRAAGMAVGRAEDTLRTAKVHYDRGSYKQAYAAARTAYVQATGVLRAP